MIFLFCKQTDFVDEWGEFKGLSLNVAKNHIKFLQKKLLIIGGFHPFNNAGSWKTFQYRYNLNLATIGDHLCSANNLDRKSVV